MAGAGVLQPDIRFGEQLLRLNALADGELAAIAGTLGREIKQRTMVTPIKEENILRQQRKYEDAVDSYDQALKIDPSQKDYWYRHGEALTQLTRYEEAVASYDQALKIKPDFHQALIARGIAFGWLGRYEEAIASHDQALKINPKAQDWYSRGFALNQLGRYEEAIASHDQALKINLKAQENWYGRGIALSRLERYEEAIASYDKALKIKPDDYRFWTSRGDALSRLERYEEAIASYDKALKIKPDDYRLWTSRGDALSRLERYEEAIASYDKALKIKPDNYRFWTSRGYALSRLERYEEAIASYDKALKIKPDDYAIWYNRGNILERLERYEEAVTSYGEMLRVTPNYWPGWYFRSRALWQLERYEEAITSYNQVQREAVGSLEKALCTGTQKLNLNVSNSQEHSRFWIAIGRGFYNLWCFEEAVASYDQALKVKSSDYEAWNGRGHSLSYLERYEEAIASYDKALEIKPDDYTIWRSRGNALGHLERYEEAIASLDQALEIKPDDYAIWDSRGDALSRLERYEEAIASYDKALEIKPDDYTIWRSRGNALGHLERYEEAIASLDQALEIKPDDYAIWDSRGDALSRLERYEEAIASYDKALEIKPDDYTIWCSRGDALGYLERYEEAIAGYDKALEIKPDNYTIWCSRGNALGYLERYEEAIASLDQSLKIKSDYWPARYCRGNVAQCRLKADLNARGYQDTLNSYRARLGESSKDEPKKAICKDTHPEDWGLLHQAIAQTHYEEGRRKSSPFPYWRKAKYNFKRALETLQPPAFEELHLQVLQQLIQVLRALGEHQEAQVLQQQGRDLIVRWLQESDRSEAQKQILRLKLGQLTQLTVDLAIQAKDILGALQQAEFAKNVCLRWLLGVEEVPEVSFQQMRSLLAAETAVIYWHLSPLSIATFLLLSDSETPLLIPPAELNDSEAEERSPQLKQLLRWESWLREWNEQYDNYGSGKDKTNSKQDLASWRRNHPWRTGLVDKLTELGQILNVEAIHQQLQAHAIESLILIPHRDLHRLPLHSFFESYPCRYLPSAQVGLQLLSQTNESPLTQLLMVENPESKVSLKHLSKKLAELPFAEVEATWVRELFRQAKSNLSPEIITLEKEQISRDNLVKALQQPSQLFHFTGHGAYDSNSPSQSCLFLTGLERLTLLDIFRETDLRGYQLVCLAACETAVSGNQTITDEYVGLTSAFLEAGATSVVSTLWRIESSGSMVFVSQFYQSFLSSQPPEVALKTAQTFLKTATYDQLLAVLEEGMELISQSGHPKAASLSLALKDEHIRLSANQREASRMGESNCPYSDPYYWNAFTLSGL